MTLLTVPISTHLFSPLTILLSWNQCWWLKGKFLDPVLSLQIPVLLQPVLLRLHERDVAGEIHTEQSSKICHISQWLTSSQTSTLKISNIIYLVLIFIFLEPKGTINAIVFNLVTTIELLTSLREWHIHLVFSRLLTIQIFSATGSTDHLPASSCDRVHHRVPEPQ